MREELDRPPHGQATRPPLWPSGLPAAGLTVLWKSSIVNSVKPWDTRSSLLLADTALNLQYGAEGGGLGLLSQQGQPPVELDLPVTGREEEPRRPSWGPPPTAFSAHVPVRPPSSPLQLLAVIQQRLQVGEPKSSIEAVPIGPGLADVGVLFVQVLQRGSPAPPLPVNSWPGPRQAKELPDKGHTAAVAPELQAGTCHPWLLSLVTSHLATYCPELKSLWKP